MNAMNAWWMSSRWAVAVAVVPAGLMLYGVCVPGGYYKQLSWSLWLWGLAGVLWIAQVRAARAALSPPPRRRRWPLLLVPAMLVATWAIAVQDVIGKQTFHRYRAGLEALGRRAHGPYDYPELGPYKFHSVGSVGTCVLYYLRDPAMALVSGFAWCPGHSPQEFRWSEREVFERIEGDWYTMLVRHGGYDKRLTGADPWGLQVTEIHKMTEA